MTRTERGGQYDPHARIEALEYKLQTGEDLTDRERDEFDGLVRNWAMYRDEPQTNQTRERQETE